MVQNGLETKVTKSRKQIKERKNRAMKIRGVKKVSLLARLPPESLHGYSIVWGGYEEGT